MKLSLLFAKFLYQHKQLNLPGIGVFSLDRSVAVPEPGDKHAHEFLQHIRFEQKNVMKPDEEFIDFIRINTGKIKPLAESDLESFISEGKILLNIGKPFHLEGIGTLQKSRSGSYDFHPGVPILHKLDTTITREKEVKATPPKQTFESDYSTGSAESNPNSSRVAWIVLAVLIGLGAIVWGGYSLYNRNTTDEGSQANVTPQPVTPLPETTENTQTDSSVSRPDTPVSTITSTAPTGNYKFVFRLASRNYVMKRYDDLKPSTPNLYWDTKDSITYRLYLSIPAQPSDTARIRDSLRTWYGSKKVIIEQ